MAIEKNIVIGADLSGLERKLDELIDALKASQNKQTKLLKQLMILLIVLKISVRVQQILRKVSRHYLQGSKV